MTETILPPIQEIHRNDLSPMVRDYADNTHQQMLELMKDAGAPDVAGFLQAAKAKVVSPDVFRTFKRLAGSLKTSIETGKVPFTEEDFNKELHRMFEVLSKDRTVSHIPTPNVTSIPKIPQYENLFKTHGIVFPTIPYEYLSSASLFAKVMFDNMLSYHRDKPQLYKDTGYFLAYVLNPSLARSTDEDFLGITITVPDQGDRIDYLGYALPGGYMRVEGKVGNHAGRRMSGGTLRLDSAEGATGAEMSGGLLHVEDIETHGGLLMEGGTLMLNHAKSSLGSYMKGGKIIGVQSLSHTGNHMKGGEIAVQHTGDFLGEAMEDGEIQCVNTGDYLGNRMGGGTIVAKNSGRLTGYQMSGGVIDIADSTGALVGEMKTGGDIYFKGEKIK